MRLGHPLSGDDGSALRSFAELCGRKKRRDHFSRFISRGDKHRDFRRVAYDTVSIVRREDGQTEDRNASGPLTEREDYCNGMTDGVGLVGWLEFCFVG